MISHADVPLPTARTTSARPYCWQRSEYGPQLLTALTGRPVGLTLDELDEQHECARGTWRPVLDALIDSDLIERVGSGRRGDPYRFRRTTS